MNDRAPSLFAGTPSQDSLPARASTDVRVGLCGFSMGMKKYPALFPVVEVQSVFYDPPSDAVLERWRAATGPGLEYTMKVSQLVTHPAASPTYRRVKSGGPPPADAGYFQHSQAVADGWKRSLGCADVLDATALLFQCPASFTPQAANVERLRGFFERIDRPRGRRLVWEPRGAAWVAQRALAIRLCGELDITFAVDPFVTPPPEGSPIYWRLHGKGGARNSYTDQELLELARMRTANEGPSPAYILFNNLPRIGDAKRFAALLQDRTANVSPPCP